MVLDNLFSCNVLKTNIRRNKDLFQVSSDWWLPQLMEFFSILNMVDKTLGIPVFIFERKIPKHVRMLLTGVSWLHIWLQSYMKVDFEMNIDSVKSNSSNQNHWSHYENVFFHFLFAQVSLWIFSIKDTLYQFYLHLIAFWKLFMRFEASSLLWKNYYLYEPDNIFILMVRYQHIVVDKEVISKCF